MKFIPRVIEVPPADVKRLQALSDAYQKVQKAANDAWSAWKKDEDAIAAKLGVKLGAKWEYCTAYSLIRRTQ